MRPPAAGRRAKALPIAFTALGLILLLGLAACQEEPPPRDEAWQKLIAPHSAYLNMGGWRVHYVDFGGDGFPVMMIHGFADSTYCWCNNAAYLRDHGFRPILVDQPGMGVSDPPPGDYVYSIENQAEAVWRIAQALGLAKLDLVGSSMGGGIALYLGLNHADQVERVIVIDPACYQPDHKPVSLILSWPVIGDVVWALTGKWWVRMSLEDVYFDKSKVSDVLVDEYAAPMVKPGYKEAVGRLAAQFFSDQFRRMTQDYAVFRPRLLIVWGAEDTWLDPEMGRRLAKAVPGSRLEMIPGAGHLPHQEKPEVVNPLMLEFLKN